MKWLTGTAVVILSLGALSGQGLPYPDKPIKAIVAYEAGASADMAARGDFKLDKLITKRFKIEEINDVVDAMKKRQIIGRWVCAWI